MNLKSREIIHRTLLDLKPVLLDKDASGPDPVYSVYTDLEDHYWINKTVINSGLIGREYPKTFGHYHSAAVEETYFVADGEGVLMLQKRQGNDEQGDKITEVLLVRAKTGDQVVIIPEYGHSWSNVGNTPLILLDNWEEGHQSGDYESIKNHQGLCYYLINDEGKIVPLKNSKYQNVPPIRWLTAGEYSRFNEE